MGGGDPADFAGGAGGKAPRGIDRDARAHVAAARVHQRRGGQQSSPNMSLNATSNPAPIAKYQTGREPFER